MVALLCAVAALLASQEGCGSTDGSFSIHDVGARPSGYCQATHFPGFPDGLGSALLVAAIYLTPVLVMAGGSIIAARRGERDILGASIALAGILVVTAIAVSLTLAHVGYAGAG